MSFKPSRSSGRTGQLLATAWRRRGIVLSVVLVAGAIAMFLSFFRTAPYRAAAGVRVDPLAIDRILNPDQVPANPPAGILDADVDLVGSAAVKAIVAAELGEAPGIDGSLVPNSNVIEIQAEARTGSRAAQVADAYASAFVTVRNEEFNVQAQAAAEELKGQIDARQATIDSLGASGDVAGRDAAAAEQAGLRQQLDRLTAQQAEGAAAAEVVAAAEVPRSPISLRPVRTAVVSVLSGLVVGFLLALVIDRFDDSIRTADELEWVTGVPVLGTVPEIAGWRSTSAPYLVTVAARQGPGAAAYESLARSIGEVVARSGLSVIEVTSPNAREGRTATVANLGVALARVGARVVTVCADLRHPRLHEFYGLSNSVGFTSVLLGKVPLSAALQSVSAHERLVLLASGPLPPKPGELLSSERVPEVLRSLRAQADIVLIDVPPVLDNTDALVIAGHAEAVVLVCAALRTDGGAARRAHDVLKAAMNPVVGTVLNGAGRERNYRSPQARSMAGARGR